MDKKSNSIIIPNKSEKIKKTPEFLCKSNSLSKIDKCYQIIQSCGPNYFSRNLNENIEEYITCSHCIENQMCLIKTIPSYTYKGN